MFEYNIENPIEIKYESFKILSKSIIIYNYILGEYLLFNLSEYIYIYLLLNFEELVIYVISLFLYQYIYFIFFHTLLRYQYLIDINAVDFYNKKYRFQLNYNLISLNLNSRLYLKTILNENNKIDSIHNVFNGVSWYEREIWDLFGIVFKYNNDLRRILTDYAFEGYPLKKDFPLSGYLEISYNEYIKRLCYNKIKLIQEFRIFELQNPWEYVSKFKFKNLYSLYLNKQNISVHTHYLYNEYLNKLLLKI